MKSRRGIRLLGEVDYDECGTLPSTRDSVNKSYKRLYIASLFLPFNNECWVPQELGSMKERGAYTMLDEIGEIDSIMGFGYGTSWATTYYCNCIYYSDSCILDAFSYYTILSVGDFLTCPYVYDSSFVITSDGFEELSSNTNSSWGVIFRVIRLSNSWLGIKNSDTGGSNSLEENHKNEREWGRGNQMFIEDHENGNIAFGVLGIPCSPTYHSVHYMITSPYRLERVFSQIGRVGIDVVGGILISETRLEKNVIVSKKPFGIKRKWDLGFDSVWRNPICEWV